MGRWYKREICGTWCKGEVNLAWKEHSRHRRGAEEDIVRRRDAEELAEYRRRHQEKLEEVAPEWREQNTLCWK